MIRKLFVYGTLQRGMYNDSFIDNDEIEWTEKAVAQGNLYMVRNATYPAIKLEDTKNLVHGELYSIKKKFIDDVIKKCDHLEGHPSFYKRKIIEVVDEKGFKHIAYVYELVSDEYLGDLIENGKYTAEHARLRDILKKYNSKK